MTIETLRTYAAGIATLPGGTHRNIALGHGKPEDVAALVALGGSERERVYMDGIQSPFVIRSCALDMPVIVEEKTVMVVFQLQEERPATAEDVRVLLEHGQTAGACTWVDLPRAA